MAKQAVSYLKLMYIIPELSFQRSFVDFVLFDLFDSLLILFGLIETALVIRLNDGQSVTTSGNKEIKRSGTICQCVMVVAGLFGTKRK